MQVMNIFFTKTYFILMSYSCQWYNDSHFVNWLQILKSFRDSYFWEFKFYKISFRYLKVLFQCWWSFSSKVFLSSYSDLTEIIFRLTFICNKDCKRHTYAVTITLTFFWITFIIHYKMFYLLHEQESFDTNVICYVVEQ